VATVHQTASSIELIWESGWGDSTKYITTEPVTITPAAAKRR
jgi:hypothetical protein